MESSTHIIETALLLLIAFLIGCAIGWFLRTRFFGVDSSTPVSGSTGGQKPSAPAAQASPSTTASTAKPAAVEPEKAAPAPAKTATPRAAAKPATKPAAKKPAKRPAAKPAKLTAVKSAAKPVAKSDTNPAAEKPSRAKPAKVTSVAQATAAPAAEAGKPQGLAAPRGGKKDDLKRISGVGPKLEGVLNGLGIYHFDQIASWDRQTVEWVDNYLSFKGRIDRDKWIDQARAFASE